MDDKKKKKKKKSGEPTGKKEKISTFAFNLRNKNLLENN